MSSPEFGIYVHWPFCAAKCPYCDFNSHVRAQIDEHAWLRAVAREMEFLATDLMPALGSVGSIFFGGGTPSLMSGRAIGETLDRIAELWSLDADVEVTLEANPSSADAERFRDYRIAGVNRLSLGVQALNDRDLKFLGRLHDVADSKCAIRLAESLFERVSIDLIYARPGQNVGQWCAELREALSFGCEHVSLYQLTIEDGTPFAALAEKGRLVQIGEDQAADMYEATQEIMEDTGLPAYEISNHAVPGQECRHNLLYWRYGAYAGIGPGAHGRLRHGGTRIATRTERLPERWFARTASEGHGFAEIQVLSREEAAREHLLMNLRLAEGLDLDAYCREWGRDIDGTKIDELVKGGFLVRHGTRIAATRQGALVLNSVIAAIAEREQAMIPRETLSAPG
jgi:putative oxygen-independent coproporphyrinogen III oxidase